MVFTVDMENTVNMILHCWHGDEGDHYGKDQNEAWNTLWKVGGRTRVSRSISKLNVARGGQGIFLNCMWHAGVQEYFQIKCRTRVSRSIFKFNVARGCPGVFSNWMSQAGVQEYFQIECRTQGSRSIFKLNVARGCPGVFSNWMSHEGVQEYFQIECSGILNNVGAEGLNTI